MYVWHPLWPVERWCAELGDERGDLPEDTDLDDGADNGVHACAVAAGREDRNLDGVGRSHDGSETAPRIIYTRDDVIKAVPDVRVRTLASPRHWHVPHRESPPCRLHRRQLRSLVPEQARAAITRLPFRSLEKKSFRRPSRGTNPALSYPYLLIPSWPSVDHSTFTPLRTNVSMSATYVQHRRPSSPSLICSYISVLILPFDPQYSLPSSFGSHSSSPPSGYPPQISSPQILQQFPSSSA